MGSMSTTSTLDAADSKTSPALNVPRTGPSTKTEYAGRFLTVARPTKDLTAPAATTALFWLKTDASLLPKTLLYPLTPAAKHGTGLLKDAYNVLSSGIATTAFVCLLILTVRPSTPPTETA